MWLKALLTDALAMNASDEMTLAELVQPAAQAKPRARARAKAKSKAIAGQDSKFDEVFYKHQADISRMQWSLRCVRRKLPTAN